MINLTETEKAYLAGIVDGEGSIGYYKRRNTFGAIVSITNTDFKLFAWLQDRITLGKVRARSGRGHWSPCWYFEITKKAEIIEFLTLLQPYMVVKLEQATLLLSYLNTEQEIFQPNGRKVPEKINDNRAEISKALKSLKGRNNLSIQ